MPALRVDGFHKAAVVGKIFRGISEFHWESQQFNPHWEFCTLKLSIYRDRMNEALKMAEWGKSEMRQNTNAGQAMTGSDSSRQPRSANPPTTWIAAPPATIDSSRPGTPA